MCEFNVGDLVRIRQWDDMVDQYGGTDSGRWIKTHVYNFINDMRNLCGKEFVITSIKHQVYDVYEVLGCGTHWHITNEMIELVEEDVSYDSEEIENFLGTININK